MEIFSSNFFEKPELIETNPEAVREIVDMISDRLPSPAPPDVLSEISVTRYISSTMSVKIASYFGNIETNDVDIDNALFYEIEVETAQLDELEENIIYKSCIAYTVCADLSCGVYERKFEEFYDEHGDELENQPSSGAGEEPMNMLHLISLKNILDETPKYSDSAYFS